MKQLILTLTCAFALQSVQAQVAPKWADKARKAVFSVITYDADHKILHTGNGFYVDTDATALSDYTLFRGAQEATVVTADGRQLTVSRIAGANSLYDVVKFRVEGDKKPAALTPATQAARVGDAVYLLPYSTSKDAQCTTGKVLQVDTLAGGHFYYTLEMKVTDKTVSCPLMNAAGEVVGMVQQGSTADKQAYAIGVGYGTSLSVGVISSADSNLAAIGIPKALPEGEDQALAYLFMGASQLPRADYELALDDFIATYPRNAEGYLRRGQYTLVQSVTDTVNTASLRQRAEADFEQVKKLSADPAEAHYNLARAYYNIGEYDRALPLIQTALSQDDKALYREQEGHILYAQERYADAAASYALVNATPQSTPATLYAEAQARRYNDQPLEAMALMDSVIARYTAPYVDDAAPYFYQRAALRAEQGKHREAVQDYNEFEHIVAGRVNARFYFEREQSEAACRMYQQAIDDIDRATRLAPQDPDLWVERGSLQLRVNHKDEAIAALRQALALDDTHATAHRILGYALTFDKKTLAEACQHLKRAQELGDEQAEGLLQKYGK